MDYLPATTSEGELEPPSRTRRLVVRAGRWALAGAVPYWLAWRQVHGLYDWWGPYEYIEPLAVSLLFSWGFNKAYDKLARPALTLLGDWRDLRRLGLFPFLSVVLCSAFLLFVFGGLIVAVYNGENSSLRNVHIEHEAHREAPALAARLKRLGPVKADDVSFRVGGGLARLQDSLDGQPLGADAPEPLLYASGQVGQGWYVILAYRSNDDAAKVTAVPGTLYRPRGQEPAVVSRRGRVVVLSRAVAREDQARVWQAAAAIVKPDPAG
jgi:hypothetical protein